MAIRHHVQLIEKIDLQSGVWLTFWDLSRRAQVSFEAKDFPADAVGEVFVLDRSGGQPHVTPAQARDTVDEAALLIPRKRNAGHLRAQGDTLDVPLNEVDRYLAAGRNRSGFAEGAYPEDGGPDAAQAVPPRYRTME